LGHSKEGYALDWSPIEEGILLSGADDTTVKLWDVSAAYSKDSSSGTQILATKTFAGHHDIVEDVAWHCKDPYLFGSVGDDKRLCLWDAREEGSPIQFVNDAHPSDVNCLAFNPEQEYVLATGGADSSIFIWDMRNLASPMNKLLGHTDQVFKIEWSPSNASILASCSADRRVAVWDMARIGEAQTLEEAADGPPELLFLHGGHTSKCSDFSWNQSKDFEWTIASISDGNILQIWNAAQDILCSGEKDADGSS